MKKRLLSTFLVLAMVLTMLPTTIFATNETDLGSAEDGTMLLVNQVEAYAATPNAVDADGESLDIIGQVNNPFKIGNATVLAELATLTNAGTTYGPSGEYSYGSASYVMVANIDVSDTSWTAIGVTDHTFNGTFNGDGYTITGLSVDTESSNQGLFGSNQGTIQNVTVYGSVTSTDSCVGGVVGYNEGTVENCAFLGDVSGSMYVGGVVGYNSGTVTGCFATGTVSASSNEIGGVVGYNAKGKVINCVSLVESVSTAGSSTSNVCRVVGHNNGGSINYNYAWSGTKIGKSGALSTTSSDSPSNADGKGLTYSSNSLATGDITTWSGIFTTLPDGWVDTMSTLPNGGELPSYITDLNATTGEGWNGTAANSFAEDGKISSAAELAYFAAQVNAGTITEGTYTLTADIDLNDVEWTAIGTSDNKFSETFDGGGYTISGLYINQSSTSYQGLFGYVGTGGEVKNVHVSGLVSGNMCVGGVVGDNYGTVSGCSFSGSVSGQGSIGGVVGYNNGAVTNCYNTGSVTSTGSPIGGVVGYNDVGATVSNCYNTGDIGGSAANVGGIVGYNGGTVSYCYNTGTVTATDGGMVGGVVGKNAATVSNCVSLANTITGDSNVGRVVGANFSGTMENNYAWAGTNVSGTATTITGTNGTTTDTDGGDGADLYYNSSTGFSTVDGTFSWSTICPTSDWNTNVPSYQLPNLMGEIAQNPLANLEFVTITFDYETVGTENETVALEIGGTLTASDIPTALTNMAWNLADAYYESATVTAIAAVAKIGDTNYASLDYAIYAAENSDTITLLANIETTETVTIDKTVTINLDGFDIDAQDNDFSVITVASGVLTIDDDNQSVDTMGKITGGDAVNGGGVYIADGADMVLTGGVITGNTAEIGGGIYVASGGTFAMENGAVTGNTATTASGVYVNGSMYAKKAENTFVLQEVYLTDGAYINLDTGYLSDAVIPVLTEIAPTAEAPVKIATGDNATPENFSAVRSYAEVVEGEDGYIYLALIETETYYAIGGIIDDGISPVEGATVTLVQGTVVLDSTTSDVDGKYSFSYVTPGTYNVVATKDTTITTLVIITDVDQGAVNITMPTYSSVLTVQGDDTPNVVVGGLDDVATAQSTSVILTVESKDDSADNADAIEAIATVTEIEYLSIDLTQSDNTLISDAGTVLEIIVPYDFTSKKNVTVYRYHGTEAEAFVEAESKLDGTYILDETNGYIYIYAKYFSTYAVGYDVKSTSSGSTNTGTIIYPDGDTSTTTTEITTDTDETIATVGGFDDVFEDDYYAAAVAWAVENGITTGRNETTFDPSTANTRAEAVTFLWRAMGSPESSGDTQFTDLDEDGYYYEAVLWAVENGITIGTSDTTFSPYDTCTRAHIVTFLWRMVGELDADTDTIFDDVSDDDYYFDAVLWAVLEEITNGMTDDTFAPNNDCTRAQIVTFLYRYFG